MTVQLKDNYKEPTNKIEEEDLIQELKKRKKALTIPFLGFLIAAIFFILAIE